MSIALMIITDAEQGVGLATPRLNYLHETIASANSHLVGDIACRFIIADCAGNTEFLHAVEDAYSWPEDGEYVFGYGQRLGFRGAIAAGWAHVAGLPVDVTHIFHLEGDFTFNKNINLDDMAECLDATQEGSNGTKLAQLALLRQACNTNESRAGGVIQADRESFRVWTSWREGEDNDFTYRPDKFWKYVAHKRFFTTNPCLYRREITELGWPQETESEGKFTIKLREQGYHFGYWQDSLDAPPSVENIGKVRSGTGY